MTDRRLYMSQVGASGHSRRCVGYALIVLHPGCDDTFPLGAGLVRGELIMYRIGGGGADAQHVEPPGIPRSGCRASANTRIANLYGSDDDPGATLDRGEGAVSDVAAPRLYYMPRTRSSRVLWLLEEIGGPYQLVEIPGAERQSEEHLRRHPLGRVPALVLGDGTTVFESAAICLQLADLNPDAGLIPRIGSAGRALVYQWVLFGMTELEGPLFRWIGELAEGVTASAAQDRFAHAATALDSALDVRQWLLDGQFTVADVICASVLAGAHSRELLAGWPRLCGYVERSQARPAYAKAAAIWDRPRT